MARKPDDHILAQLRCYGARAEDVAVLNDGDVMRDPKHRIRQIRYLDLVRRPANDLGELWPRAVVETTEGQPVLYVVEGRGGAVAPDNPALTRLRQILWFRASAEYVALIEPGRLTLYPVASGRPTPRQVAEDSAEAAALIPSIAFPPAAQSPHESTAAEVHKLLLSLLTATTDALIRLGVAPLDALSLVGRALFVRFLIDRGVLSRQEVEEITGVTPERCFQDSEHAAKISKWLDDTFNGDFLPLPEKGAFSWFRRLRGDIFAQLTKVILRAEPSGQIRLTWGSGWHDLLFDHIPVGLLSQVYELHAHRYDAERARETSVYYTPRYVAEYMIDEIFPVLGDRAPKARVLDPAVGGGVFLVAAFRRLAAERWRADRKPPDTRALREILYEQLRGFDISEPALRLCSLGMYLTAIELDPHPRPPSGLKFDKPLLGTVLHHVAAASPKQAYLGSLGTSAVGPEHRGAYDVVVGNPPWTSWKASRAMTKSDVKAQVQEVERSVRNVVRARLGDQVADRYEMVDRVPDIPFFWRATEWAREGGLIALALNARLLFKQSEPGRDARNDLFAATQVTGVLNGAALRDTKFWPSVVDAPSGFKPSKIRSPFCLIFAKNTLPPEESSFYFASPEMEKGLNDLGRLRLDPGDARPVEVAELRRRPALLKLRFRGTELDAGIMARVEDLQLPTLGDYWDRHGYARGEGFQVVAGGSPAGEMARKPSFTTATAAEMPYLIDVSRLQPLGDLPLHRPRDPAIYKAPLVIVDSTPPVERSAHTSGAYLALKDVVYNESFFGFSCAGMPKGDRETWARYLFLLLNTRFAIYFALLTSSKFGIERDVFLFEDIKRLPLVPVEALRPALKEAIHPLSEDLVRDPRSSFDRIERWAAGVYGLSRLDVETINDTLAVSPPFAHTRARAQSRPETSDLRAFERRLCSVIRPFLARHRRAVSARVVRNELDEAWIIVQVDAYEEGAEPLESVDTATVSREVIAQADSLAASQIIVVRPPATLLIAMVAQYRYFTVSRARITALEIVHEHSIVLLGEAGG